MEVPDGYNTWKTLGAFHQHWDYHRGINHILVYLGSNHGSVNPLPGFGNVSAFFYKEESEGPMIGFGD